MIVLFQAKRGEKMKAKNMKAEIVKVIRTDTAEGKGTEEEPDVPDRYRCGNDQQASGV